MDASVIEQLHLTAFKSFRDARGCGDLSILVERDRYLARVARDTTAAVWTLDAGLQAYA